MDGSLSRKSLVNSTTESSFNDQYSSPESSIGYHPSNQGVPITFNNFPRFYIGEEESADTMTNQKAAATTGIEQPEFRITIDGSKHDTDTAVSTPLKECSLLLNHRCADNNTVANRFITCESEALIINNQEGGIFVPDLDLPSKNDKINDGDFNKSKLFSTVLQVFLALFISSGGNFGAGIILDEISKWTVFSKVPELYYLIPTLLGLKGNLEMTMVARLSTKANMGDLRTFKQAVRSMVHNIALVQSQAMVVSFLASFATLLASYYEVSNQTVDVITESTFDANGTLTKFESANAYPTHLGLYYKILVIFSSSIATANIACFGSSLLMIIIIVTLSHYKINPDNFATAVAASIGDIVTSFVLGIISQYIYTSIVANADSVSQYSSLAPITIIVISFLIFPFTSYLACKEKTTKQVLLGAGAWTPILLAMVISFFSGAALRFSAVLYRFMTLYQPLINGVGGNLAAIATSRLSTDLHINRSQAESSSPNESGKQESLYQIFTKTIHSFLKAYDDKNMLILFFLIISIIVQLTYGSLLKLAHDLDTNFITLLFFVFYIIASSLQVLVLLVLTRFFVHVIWWFRGDPDTCAIPILTALGDLLGTMFLFGVFAFLQYLGDSSALAPQLQDVVPFVGNITIKLPITTTKVPIFISAL